jgi:hypothetical protein
LLLLAAGSALAAKSNKTRVYDEMLESGFVQQNFT